MHSTSSRVIASSASLGGGRTRKVLLTICNQGDPQTELWRRHSHQEFVRESGVTTLPGGVLSGPGTLLRCDSLVRFLPKAIPVTALNGFKNLLFGMAVDALLKSLRPTVLVPNFCALRDASQKDRNARLHQAMRARNEVAFIQIVIERARPEESETKLAAEAIKAMRTDMTIAGLPDSTPPLLVAIATGRPVYRCSTFVSHPELATALNTGFANSRFVKAGTSPLDTLLNSVPAKDHVPESDIYRNWERTFTEEEVGLLFKLLHSAPQEGESHV